MFKYNIFTVSDLDHSMSDQISSPYIIVIQNGISFTQEWVLHLHHQHLSSASKLTSAVQCLAFVLFVLSFQRGINYCFIFVLLFVPLLRVKLDVTLIP